jgi:segregation and condensation protein B
VAFLAKPLKFLKMRPMADQEEDRKATEDTVQGFDDAVIPEPAGQEDASAIPEAPSPSAETKEAAVERPDEAFRPDEIPDGAVISESSAEAEVGDAEGEITVNAGVLEAMLFSTHHPLTGGQLAELLDVPSTKPIRKAIRQLNEQYEHAGRCFRIEQVAGGFQMLTLPMYGEALKSLHHREADSRLTKSALETLAIIAYKQPILRADVEAIRGVASGETIRSLMEKHLVKIAGRAELPGRPILYGTTRRFLEVFGLNSLRDLPQAELQNKPRAAVPALPPEVQKNLAEETTPPAEEADQSAADAAAAKVREVGESEVVQHAEEHEAAEPSLSGVNLPASEGDDLNSEGDDLNIEHADERELAAAAAKPPEESDENADDAETIGDAAGDGLCRDAASLGDADDEEPRRQG